MRKIYHYVKNSMRKSWYIGKSSMQKGRDSSAAKTRNATVTVNNNDADKGLFRFSVTGTTVAPERHPPRLTTLWANSAAGRPIKPRRAGNTPPGAAVPRAARPSGTIEIGRPFSALRW